MSIFNLFRRSGSAPLARERLQILLSHERTVGGRPDLLTILREEILTTIAKQVPVDRENVRVRMDRGATVSTLEIDIDIPHLGQYAPRSQYGSIVVSRFGSTTSRKPLSLLATP
jgi:cell division topological specificity factor